MSCLSIRFPEAAGYVFLPKALGLTSGQCRKLHQIIFIKMRNLMIIQILTIEFVGRKSLIFFDFLFAIEKKLLSLQSLI